MKFLVILASIYLVSASPKRDTGVTRIIGGADASISDFPWQLSMEYGASHSCGAVAVGANWALTAAHCVDGRTADLVTIKAGMTDRNEDSSLYQEMGCTEITMHELYADDPVNPGGPDDIAILTLDANFNTVDYTIELIPMATDADGDFAGDICQISGWGRTGTSNALSNTLQYADITILTNADCDDAMDGVIGGAIGPGHICLYDPAEEKTSCNGDSGGPMNCIGASGGDVDAGITSWGVSSGGNCLTRYPAVYTRVSYYYDWVMDNAPVA